MYICRFCGFLLSGAGLMELESVLPPGTQSKVQFSDVRVK